MVGVEVEGRSVTVNELPSLLRSTLFAAPEPMDAPTDFLRMERSSEGSLSSFRSSTAVRERELVARFAVIWVRPMGVAAESGMAAKVAPLVASSTKRFALSLDWFGAVGSTEIWPCFWKSWFTERTSGRNRLRRVGSTGGATSRLKSTDFPSFGFFL